MDEKMEPIQSAGNAVKHGLTAKKVLPENLRRQTAEMQQKLAAELQPASILENILVDELSRHAAALKFTSQAEPAVLRKGAAAEMQLATFTGANSDPVDVCLFGAVTSKGSEKLTRYRRAHERGFYTALDKLSSLRTTHTFATAPDLRERFATESACHLYLVERRLELPCSRCCCAQGSWLPTRERWECRDCKSQLGIRAETVMEHSPLPLAAWFAAILTLSTDTTVTVAELVRATGINRTQTIRTVMAKILAAASRPPAEAEGLLAGLPQLCIRCRRA